MMATAFLGFSNSPKWVKLNDNSISNKQVIKKITGLKSSINLFPLSKNNVKCFSTFSSALNVKPDNFNNVPQKHSKDVLDFLNDNNLKPVNIYENVSDKYVQNRILDGTKNIAGVYLILNKVNLSCYVGSASTGKFNARFRKHLFNFSGSKIVKAAVKKYKIENFVFMILHIFPETVTKENNKKLLDLEDYYLKLLLPDYNIVTEAGNTFGYKHSEITRIKMRDNYSVERRIKVGDLNRGKPMSEVHKTNLKIAAFTRKKPTYSDKALANMKKKSKSMIVYNLDRTVYGEYPSITEAAKSLRCNMKTISRALSTPKNIVRRR